MKSALETTDWAQPLNTELAAPYFTQLAQFVDEERKRYAIYPSSHDVFNAFTTTAYADTRVVILGQDPYHGPGQAHGLCFSVPPGIAQPPSLKNILKELADDLDITPPKHGCLQRWAQQGVLLLNTVLTVRDGQANAHQKQGWERFTDAVIRVLGQRSTPCIFVLWGNPAQKKRALIDSAQHPVIESAHPSPLSAYRGFFGSKPFSRINQQLIAWGQAPIDWVLT
jgi:uracil-DNA glycosylase